MKLAYQIIMEEIDNGFVVTVPDFTMEFTAPSIVDAISIARENITDSIKNGSGIRVPSLRVKGRNENDLIGFVDLDI